MVGLKKARFPFPNSDSHAESAAKKPDVRLLQSSKAFPFKQRTHEIYHAKIYPYYPRLLSVINCEGQARKEEINTALLPLKAREGKGREREEIGTIKD